MDEVNSSQIDAVIKQQDVMARTIEHQEKIKITSAGSIATSTGKGLTLMKAPVYMALFGLIFAVLGWAGGEIVQWQQNSNPLYEIKQMYASINSMSISDREKNQLIENCINSEHFKDNKYAIEIKAGNIEKLKVIREDDERMLVRLRSCWYMIIAMFIACGLAIAESVMTRNWDQALRIGTFGIILGIAGGFIINLFIDKLYNELGGGRDATICIQIFARSIGWGVLGLFVAIAPGILMGNKKKLLLGLFGGLIGGLIGGLLFDPIGMLGFPVQISRLVGIVGFGVAAGIATSMLENAAKQGWLKVVSGMIAGKQFILYRNPTYIGSSPKSEIYLFKDSQIAGKHAAIYLFNGDFLLEDVSGGGTYINGKSITKQRLKNGDTVAIGSTTFIFEAKTVKK